MKAGAGKSKGNGYEREVAKKLSLLFTQGQEEYAIWRTDSSGAASTTLHRKGKQTSFIQSQAADLRQVCDKGIFPVLDRFCELFMIETKFYADCQLWPPWKADLGQKLDQVISDRSKVSKHIFFILKLNRKGEFVFTDSEIPFLPKYMTLYYYSDVFNMYLLKDLLEKPSPVTVGELNAISKIQAIQPR